MAISITESRVHEARESMAHELEAYMTIVFKVAAVQLALAYYAPRGSAEDSNEAGRAIAAEILAGLPLENDFGVSYGYYPNTDGRLIAPDAYFVVGGGSSLGTVLRSQAPTIDKSGLAYGWADQERLDQYAEDFWVMVGLDRDVPGQPHSSTGWTIRNFYYRKFFYDSGRGKVIMQKHACRTWINELHWFYGPDLTVPAAFYLTYLDTSSCFIYEPEFGFDYRFDGWWQYP